MSNDKVIAKLNYNIPTSENQEVGENGFLKTEKETLARVYENIDTDKAKKEIESLIDQGYEVNVTVKLKIPKD